MNAVGVKCGGHVPGWAGDACPAHGSPARKCYTFGANDAEVWVFRGCGCAVSVNAASACCGGRDTDVMYHASYERAAGRARLIGLHWRTW